MTLVKDEERFVKHCQDAYEYISTLRSHIDKGGAVLPEELLAELSSVVEELSVAGEELNQQSEELTATRDELARQRQHYHDLFELAPDGYLVTDQDGCISECNLAGATLLHMLHKHLIGKPITVFVANKDQKAFRLRLDKLTKDKSWRSESWVMMLQPRDQEPFHALITVRATHNSEDAGIQLSWFIHDISREQELQEQRQMLLSRLVKAHEEERTRLARDLHDNMSQHLTALVIGLQSLRDSGPKQATSEMDSLQHIAEELGHEMHRIATELRPPALNDLGLAKSLADFVQEWSQTNNIAVSFHQSGFAKTQPSLPSDIKISIYRIVQQALTNILKHAKAEHVSVVLERRSDELIAIVEDNGVGFDVEKTIRQSTAKRSLGLIGMRERATMIGGTLEIESKPGAGTTIFVHTPLVDVDEKEVTV